MLEDVSQIRRMVIACGTVDLRKGIDGLSRIIGDQYGKNPFEKGTLFLFLLQTFGLYEGVALDGKRIPPFIQEVRGWPYLLPRTTTEDADLSEEQFRYLIIGLNALDPKVKQVHPTHLY